MRECTCAKRWEALPLHGVGEKEGAFLGECAGLEATPGSGHDDHRVSRVVEVVIILLQGKSSISNLNFPEKTANSNSY